MQLFSRGAIAGAALVAAATLATFAAAQDTQAPTPPPGQQRRGAGAPGEPAAAANQQPQRQLPADSVTQHSVELPGRTLKFSATAGSIAMRNAEGRLTAEIAYIAYTLTDAEAKTRPVTFALNGGPGSASAWVHLGGFGPWRVAMDGAAISPSAQPALLPNAETWLDFTDLVFVDPVGTGFSRVARSTGGEGGAGAGANPNAPQSGPQANRGGGFYSVNGDVDSLAEMIHLWLRKHNRIASPKMLVGESYSGIRAPKIVYQLQTKYGAGFNAMVMLSPVLDYGMIRNNRNQPMAPVIMLPSIAAAAKEAKGEKLSRSGMAEIETYARGEFLADLMRGPRDGTAIGRIIKNVAALSGLDEATVRRYGGRLDGTIYRREANRASGTTASPYDASVKGIDIDPTAILSRQDDPFTTGLAGPVVAAMLDLYQNRFNWRAEGQYHLSNPEVNRAWTYGTSTSPPESVSELKQALALDPNLFAVVTNGFTDMVTPYFMNALVLDQIPVYGNPDRLRLLVYPGGHMYYAREGSRIAFRQDMQSLLAAAVRPVQ